MDERLVGDKSQEVAVYGWIPHLSQSLLTTAVPLKTDPAMIVLACIGALGLVYFMFLRPKAKNAGRRGDPLKAQPSQRQSLSAERASERAMQSLVLELEQLARKMGAQLDTKAAKLDALIREADEKATMLKGAITQAKAAGISDAVVRGKSGHADSGLAALGRHNDIYSLSDNGSSPDEIARKLNRPSGEVELILALRDR